MMKSRRLLLRLLCGWLCVVSLSCVDPEASPPAVSVPVPDSTGEESRASPLPYPVVRWGGEPMLSDDERIWFGDLDGMIERRTLRVLVVYSKSYFFLDGITPRGIAYDSMREFEKSINRRLGNLAAAVHFIYLPVATEQLIPALNAGLGDIAVANLTVTEARRNRIDFSRPVLDGVEEIVVSGPGAPAVSRAEDLAGLDVHVRASSSYYQHLTDLNRQFADAGLEPIRIVRAHEHLEDEDLLELVNAGTIPFTVIDEHIANLWQAALEHITLHRDIRLAPPGSIAWAFRKNSPQLAQALNDFIARHGEGTLFGNVTYSKYLQSDRYVSNPLESRDMARLRRLLPLLQQYADRYGFEWPMIAAQAYQESLLDQSRRSPAGAIGVMQLLPSTAADKNVNIPHIEKVENNIHAGAKYLRFIADRYFRTEAMDDFNQTLFALAAYNAGPARIARLRREAESAGLDPNVWFDNVEIIAARRIGRETVQYVGNILKYWLSYKMLAERGVLEEDVEGA